MLFVKGLPLLEFFILVEYLFLVSYGGAHWVFLFESFSHLWSFSSHEVLLHAFGVLVLDLWPSRVAL